MIITMRVFPPWSGDRALIRRDEVAWRYRTRNCKHALPLAAQSMTGHDDIALCGIASGCFGPEAWKGTGSQVEYDTVTVLPECKRCAQQLEPDKTAGGTT
jgi:hypothetical protein